MRRLYLLVEGQTEERVAVSLLAPHLRAFGLDVCCIIVETSRGAAGRKHRGGGSSWNKWHADLRRVSGDSRHEILISTLFDLYGLPKDFPGLEEHGGDTDTLRRAAALEKAMAEAVDDQRFIPYLQRHEFEALVLASMEKLRELLDDVRDLDGVSRLQKQIVGMRPEDVNDGKDTAPSKRLKRFIPSYVKDVHGPLAIEACGLRALRERCPRFAAWLEKLESSGTFQAH